MRLITCLFAAFCVAACASSQPNLPPPTGTKVYADPNTAVYVSGGVQADFATDL